MTSLLIYDGEIDISGNEDYSYCLNSGNVKGTKSLNDGKKLNSIAEQERDNYCDYVYSINKEFIKNNLVFEKKLSLYFVSDVSNKRTEIYDTYLVACHLVLLKESIEKHNIQEVKFVDCNCRFLKSFKSFVPNVKITTINIKEIKLYNKYVLHQSKFFIKTFLQLLVFKVMYKNKKISCINRLFLTMFPIFFDKNFLEEKYRRLVKSKDMYLISIITDGMHQSLSFYNSILMLRKLALNSKDKFILLDVEVSLFDALRNYIYAMYLFFKLRKLTQKQYIFKGMDLSSYFYEEINISILRVPRLTLYKNALKRICKADIKKFYYYLHEFSYGKFFTYMLKEYSPSTQKVGFQHGPASNRKLLYFLSKYEVNYSSMNFLKYLPMPDVVMAEDKASKEVYKQANYKNVKIMKEIYRLDYLKDIKRYKVQKNSVLIACGLHDAFLLFNQLKDEIIFNKQKKYYFKLHPKSNKEYIENELSKYSLSNFEIANGDISYYLNFIEEVVCTYSSVGLEAKELGIKVRTLLVDNKINESPLLDKLLKG